MTHDRFLWAVLICIGVTSVAVADWPMHRAGAARTGYTAEKLPGQLKLRWRHDAPHAPQPAWPRSARMPFDRAYQTVIGNGRVFFGSSVDGAVYALGLDSGKPLWSFDTEGPIRFAPVLWRDRVLAVSDDGCLYALAAADGTLLWKTSRRSGPIAGAGQRTHDFEVARPRRTGRGGRHCLLCGRRVALRRHLSLCAERPDGQVGMGEQRFRRHLHGTAARRRQRQERDQRARLPRRQRAEAVCAHRPRGAGRVRSPVRQVPLLPLAEVRSQRRHTDDGGRRDALQQRPGL